MVVVVARCFATSLADEPITYTDFPSIKYNDDLCPSKGDKAVYRTNDTICINIFNQDYDEIVLKKDDVIVAADNNLAIYTSIILWNQASIMYIFNREQVRRKLFLLKQLIPI